MRIIVASALFLFTACGAALELQTFDGRSTEKTGAQQVIAVDVKALTFNEVRFLNSQPFERRMQRTGMADQARPVLENEIVAINAPPVSKAMQYRIGAGDVLSLSLVGARSVQPSKVNALTGGEVDLSVLSSSQSEPAILSSSSKVAADGSVLFLKTGKLKLEGLTLSEAEELISNALVRNNVDPLFQLTVVDFASQHVTLITSAISDVPGSASLFPYKSPPITLRGLLSAGGIGFESGRILVVKLKRAGKTYSMPLEHIFEARSPDYYLHAGDVVVVEAFDYAENNAYLSVSSGTPVIFPLKYEKRKSLADMLFTEGGPLSERKARLSEIYVLRGNNPISAYHLDARDVTRLTVARELELRPNDIVFVSDKPVYSAFELMSLLNPFRSLVGGL